MPLLAPWPFCGKTFYNVDHELREDARKLKKWEHPWLTYTSEDRILRISSTIMTALENSTRLYEACLVSTVEEAQFRSVKCIRIYPQNYDPTDLSNFDFGEYTRSDNVTENINAIEELYQQEDKPVIQGTVITAF